MTSEQLQSTEFLTPEQGRINEIQQAIQASEIAFAALNIVEEHAEQTPVVENIAQIQEDNNPLDVDAIRVEVDRQSTRNYREYPYAA